MMTPPASYVSPSAAPQRCPVPPMPTDYGTLDADEGEWWASLAALSAARRDSLFRAFMEGRRIHRSHV